MDERKTGNLPTKSKSNSTNNVSYCKVKKKPSLNNSDVNNCDVKSRKKQLTHQTMFFKKVNHKKGNENKSRNVQKVLSTPKAPQSYKESWKKLSQLPLRERMMETLKSARFRYLNEQLYTSTGKQAKQYFDQHIDAYIAYHEGYRLQVSRWPINPIDVLIKMIQKLPLNLIIADFGCGDAKLAKSVPHKVHSFDLVAFDPQITACDMAHVPLKNKSVDVAVFCLSLMGKNLKEYILEAKRVLKNNGLLMIAEVESRFEDINRFIADLHNYGFMNNYKDLSHDLFCFLIFVLKLSKSPLNPYLPNITLKPCLYKKR